MSKTGSKAYVSLLHRALDLLESLAPLGIEVGPWTLGGGTVLMLRHQHRESRDIDLFLSNPQLLPALSPRLNDAAASLTESYDESSSSLKLALDEGEIDFIVAPSLLGLAALPFDFEGRPVPTDPSVEIIAKKLFYRAVNLKVRDVIDLAIVLDREPGTDEILRTALPSRRDILLRRLDLLESTFEARVREEVALLPVGEALLPEALSIARTFALGL